MLKFNGNQRYATTAITASIMREVSDKCKVPLQVHIHCICIYVSCIHVHVCHNYYVSVIMYVQNVPIVWLSYVHTSVMVNHNEMVNG